MTNKGYTFEIKIDFFDQPDEDEELKKNPGSTLPGSFWQWSVGNIWDNNGTVINKQSVIQRDVMCKNGGFKFLLKDIAAQLPRFLDENGLRNT